MLIFQEIEILQNYLKSSSVKNKLIGLVPTMGALHEGHLSLIREAKRTNEIVVCSIFVNPMQFNDPNDLVNYPKTLESDIEKLKSVDCSLLFAPSVEEMYKDKIPSTFAPIGPIENMMEGAFRPGHFKGVITVVQKLFDIIKPGIAYFGEKDFQQLAIIKSFVKNSGIPIKIAGCEIIREIDGLAMSSRNIHLNTAERKEAPVIFKTLSEINSRINNTSIDEIKKWVIKSVESKPLMKVDYFEIIDSDSFLPISDWHESKNIRACIAVKTGKIRLLDNVAIFS